MRARCPRDQSHQVDVPPRLRFLFSVSIFSLTFPHARQKAHQFFSSMSLALVSPRKPHQITSLPQFRTDLCDALAGIFASSCIRRRNSALLNPGSKPKVSSCQIARSQSNCASSGPRATDEGNGFPFSKISGTKLPEAASGQIPRHLERRQSIHNAVQVESMLLPFFKLVRLEPQPFLRPPHRSRGDDDSDGDPRHVELVSWAR